MKWWWKKKELDLDDNEPLNEEVVWEAIDLADDEILIFERDGKIEFVSKTPIKDEEDLRSRVVRVLNDSQSDSES